MKNIANKLEALIVNSIKPSALTELSYSQLRKPIMVTCKQSKEQIGYCKLLQICLFCICRVVQMRSTKLQLLYEGHTKNSNGFFGLVVSQLGSHRQIRKARF